MNEISWLTLQKAGWLYRRLVSASETSREGAIPIQQMWQCLVCSRHVSITVQIYKFPMETKLKNFKWKVIFNTSVSIKVFPGGSDSKESPCQCRRHGFDPWVRKIPWRRKWQPTPGFLYGEPPGQRSLASYSPWGRKRVRTWLSD